MRPERLTATPREPTPPRVGSSVMVKRGGSAETVPVMGPVRVAITKKRARPALETVLFWGRTVVWGMICSSCWLTRKPSPHECRWTVIPCNRRADVLDLLCRARGRDGSPAKAVGQAAKGRLRARGVWPPDQEGGVGVRGFLCV